MQSIGRKACQVSIATGCLVAMCVGSVSVSCADESELIVPPKFINKLIELAEKLNREPSNKLLRKSVAAQCIRIAQFLKSEPKEALEYWHRANYFDSSNSFTLNRIDAAIKDLGKDPGSFSDRVAIATECRASRDFTGAVFEYSRALSLKDDGPTHEKLGDVYRVLDEHDKAIQQYLAAKRFSDNASIEVKLGQEYLASRDVGRAKQAYESALELKNNKSNCSGPLTSGWEEALKQVMHPEATKPLDALAQPQLDFTELSNRIKVAWLPPKRADFKTAKLSARLLAGGGIADSKIVSSSGDSTFDHSALKAIELLKKTGHGLTLPASLVDSSTSSSSSASGSSSSCTIEFQHIIGGPKIVLVSL